MDMAGMEQRLSDIRGITLKSLLENPTFLQPPTNNNEGKDGKKNKEDGLLDGFDNVAEDMAAAFLGPALWDKTPYDDLKLEYMDLDEFLSENGITFSSSEGKDGSSTPAEQNKTPESGAALSPSSLQSPLQSPLPSPLPPSPPPTSLSPTLMQKAAMNIPSPTPSPPPQSPEVACPPDMSPVREPSPVHIDVTFDISETDVALATAPGQDHFDPKNCQFTDEELKPQPMIKKSRKVYVPEERKDNKYWERRRKNNIAAKRSRDARRIKENQIVIRAAYLEKENGVLKGDILDLKKENSMLKKIIATYEKRLNMKMD